MKIKYSQFRKMVVEEMKKLGMLPVNESDDLEAVEDVEAEEVEPGAEGRHNEKELDMLKALKIRESRLLKSLAETRHRMKKYNVKR